MMPFMYRKGCVWCGKLFRTSNYGAFLCPDCRADGSTKASDKVPKPPTLRPQPPRWHRGGVKREEWIQRRMKLLRDRLYKGAEELRDLEAIVSVEAWRKAHPDPTDKPGDV